MNERIKLLAKQAAEIVPEKIWDEIEGMYYVENRFQLNPEKFAELIVRGCASVAQDFVTVENNKMVEKIHISPWHLQNTIKEHFGVE